MGSYEDEIKTKMDENSDLPERLSISVLKYFWQASPLSRTKDNIIPKFLRSVHVLKNFSDNELRILSNHLHLRSFENQETIFNQDQVGVGFYFIFSGNVEIYGTKIGENESGGAPGAVVKNGDKVHITTLERNDYFGELALLQEVNLRTASAISRGASTLLGIFRPDMEELIDHFPVVGAKLLQSISMILANRMTAMSNEIRLLKYKFSRIEQNDKRN
ncbi:MAG: cyclic nucleotide-binding domain-containing protein [Bacteriovoracaceae bacterium]|jgi:CRP/FNR family transcriptional regulator, cyclic AMP receptor protein|nr:cyclic nucleotide-binding domain-containing protein [Bacteriovoracaceae bacterium]